MSAYDRQINSPVEGTADRSVGWKNDSQSFFSTFWTFMRCTACMYVSLPAHDPPVSFSLPPFFVLSSVYSGFYFCSKWRFSGTFYQKYYIIAD